MEEFLFGVSMKLIIIFSIPSPYSSIRSTKGFPHIFPSTGENMFYAQTQALGKGHYASVFYKTTLLKSVWFLELRLVGGNDFYVTYATDVAVWFSFLPAWDVIMLLDPCCSRMLLAILPVRPLGRPSVTAFSQESFIAFF